MSVICLLLSGGAGTRLWPLSRYSRPKQFLKLGGDHTLFQNTVLRCRSNIFDSEPLVIAANSHRFLVAEDLREIDVQANIILEPVSRNSCAAITAGCFAALQRNSEAMVLVLAADHAINDRKGFENAVADSIPIAAAGKFVTFGIKPTHAATGYGYIQAGKQVDGTAGFSVRSFVEKPDRSEAVRYLDEGYLWNSGNFMFLAKSFLEEVKRLMPDLYRSVQNAFGKGNFDLDFYRLDESEFAMAENVSVDYAVMEKTNKVVVVPVDYDWSDIGTWHSVWLNHNKDECGNAANGNAIFEASSGNFVHSDHHLTTLLGVNDMIVITTRDAVLIAPRSESEQVKDLVERLGREEKPEVNQALQVFRPWGNYETLDVGEKYQVKRIIVSPGGELSLQRHEKRAEHWVVVEGTPDVEIGEVSTRLEPNQSVYVPLGVVHRLANHTDEPVVLIEVQTGVYLGEDDIIRFEDRYNRQPDEC